MEQSVLRRVQAPASRAITLSVKTSAEENTCSEAKKKRKKEKLCEKEITNKGTGKMSVRTSRKTHRDFIIAELFV